MKAGRYGAAVDIGTTSLAAAVWDLDSGRCVGTADAANPQRAYGADVITRVWRMLRKPEEGDKLRRILLKGIGQCVLSCCGEEVRPEEIGEYVLVGNTVMSHIFAGQDISTLAASPCVPAYRGTLLRTAASFGLPGAPGASAYVAPGIGGHVGADITAGILAEQLQEQQGKVLFIDAGTNGEIVTVKDGRLAACSTAAGPAFEGASLSCGMRASEGAVEGVRLGASGPVLDVIGGAAARGICGSGVIDAAAEMLRTGIMDRTGRIRGKKDLAQAGVPEGLAAYVKEYEDTCTLVLSEKEGRRVYISQKDIREIQLAKGAVLAGAELLLREQGMSAEELDGVILAGSFGSGLRKENAIAAGLLPDVDPGIVRIAGNTALAGASRMLCLPETRAEAEAAAEAAEYVDLAAHPDFQEAYVAAMNF